VARVTTKAAVATDARMPQPAASALLVLLVVLPATSFGPTPLSLLPAHRAASCSWTGNVRQTMQMTTRTEQHGQSSLGIARRSAMALIVVGISPHVVGATAGLCVLCVFV